MSTVQLRALFQRRLGDKAQCQSLTVTGHRIKGVRKQRIVALISGEEVSKTVAGNAELSAVVESMAASYLRKQKDKDQ